MKKKIVNIVLHVEGDAILHLEGGDFVCVDAEYMEAHKPCCGGYYVRGESGESFSAEA